MVLGDYLDQFYQRAFERVPVEVQRNQPSSSPLFSPSPRLQLRGPVPDCVQAQVRLGVRAREVRQEVLRLVGPRLLRPRVRAEAAVRPRVRRLLRRGLPGHLRSLRRGAAGRGEVL